MSRAFTHSIYLHSGLSDLVPRAPSRGRSGEPAVGEDTAATSRRPSPLFLLSMFLSASRCHGRNMVALIRRPEAFLRRCRLFVLKGDLRESLNSRQAAARSNAGSNPEHPRKVGSGTTAAKRTVKERGARNVPHRRRNASRRRPGRPTLRASPRSGWRCRRRRARRRTSGRRRWARSIPPTGCGPWCRASGAGGPSTRRRRRRGTS